MTCPDCHYPLTVRVWDVFDESGRDYGEAYECNVCELTWDGEELQAAYALDLVEVR